ncbi:MAG TPA: phosphoribosylamine--glycine ligase [Treponemataceae bacterium]|nr:phosphoribosylamine--glycine ligase [Treponemataceae bacterium]
MKTIVIGSGGREHAIAWALAKSPEVSEVLCIPGNGGTAIEKKCYNKNISVQETSNIVEACVEALAGCKDDSFIVIGPEDPLAAGLANKLSEKGLRVVGPQALAAMLEASKDVAKKFMHTYGIACAASKTCSTPSEAITEVSRINGPVVVKADGLAAGKGVVVAPDSSIARRAIHDFMTDKTLGSAGQKVVIEEYLEGEEISILAAVSVSPALAESGRACILPFVTARDHKRLMDGAKGPNTGGMGAIAPAPDVSDEVLARFKSDILEPTLKGLIAEKYEYKGFIFFGVMVTASGPKLLEYNVRLGDPETQAVLPLMESDFTGLCTAIIDGTLDTFPLSWKKGFVCAPVAVSRGYPGPYSKGLPISIDDSKVDSDISKIFIAGGTINQRSISSRPNDKPLAAGQLVTSGGRVLCSSAFGSTVEEARATAYASLEAVTFEGMFYRNDIGLPGAAVSGNLS